MNWAAPPALMRRFCWREAMDSGARAEKMRLMPMPVNSSR
jgi:hypothetical protein